MAIVLGEQFRQAARFLAFRPFRPDLLNDRRRWLVFGFVCTWLAGIGRYWDHPNPALWQLLGLGSIAYVVVLSAFLWQLLRPLRPAIKGYTPILLFVMLTSPLAWLYAVPVERFMSMESAAQTNAWFLGIVATWRVALWVWFLRRAALLRWTETVTMTVLPLTAIVSVLAILNLEQAVFNLMGGIPEHARTSADASYAIVFGLAYFSFLALPISLIAYATHVMSAPTSRKSPASGYRAP